jgi:threonine dehydrogenase-like Zn-dependent dehydrogenase
MKNYVYHVSYYRNNKKDEVLGDTTATTTRPIETAEHLSEIREAIRGDDGGTVVILGFTLLRTEEDEA